jgi:hypothetical protein
MSTIGVLLAWLVFLNSNYYTLKSNCPSSISNINISIFCYLFELFDWSIMCNLMSLCGVPCSTRLCKFGIYMARGRCLNCILFFSVRYFLSGFRVYDVVDFDIYIVVFGLKIDDLDNLNSVIKLRFFF